MDFAANGAYNMTFMVEEAAKAGKPFVAVSIACESILVPQSCSPLTSDRPTCFLGFHG